MDGRGERTGRTGARARWCEALVELASRLDGPVLDPHGIDALVELAGAPRDGLRRRLAVVGATSADDVAAVLRWAGEERVAVAVPGGGLLGDPLGPTVVVTLTRADRITLDPVFGRVRAGVGATWAGIAAYLGRPEARPVPGRTVAATLARLPPAAVPGVCAVTLAGLDGAVVEVTPGRRPELWTRLRAPCRAAELLGVVTGIELDLRAPGARPRHRPTA